MMLRIEAGLPLIDVEFHNSRLAFTDADRFTPKELGMGWMLRGIDDDRAFVGRDAIRRELAEGTSRWSSVGIVADWQHWDRLYREAGLLPPKDEHPLSYESMLYDDARAPGRLRHRLHVLPRAATPHRAGPRAPLARGDRAPRCSSSSPSTITTPPCWPAPRSCRTSTPSERRRDTEWLKSSGGPSTTSYDAIVVGAGHNGLVNGAYLAKAGLRTLILERRHLVGGAAITEELRPGFQFTTFSYALSLLRPDIIQELDLVTHGFMPLMMPSSFHPMENGDYLLLGDDHDLNIQEIKRHSPHDADAYDRYHHDLDRVCQAVRPLFDNPPPNIFGKDPEDAADIAWLLSHLGGIEQKVLHDAVRLLTGQRVGLAGRLLRERDDQGLPRVVEHHRLQGRPDVAGLRAGAALPQDGRARRAPRLVGAAQERQRRLHPGAGAAPRRRTAPRSGWPRP